MKSFLVLYKCSENSINHLNWMSLSQEDKKERLIEGKVQMENWTKKYGNLIKFEGSSLGTKTLSVDSNGILEIPSKIGKFTVIEAASHEEAANIFLDHPHFKCFPGDSLDILEFIDDRE